MSERSLVVTLASIGAKEKPALDENSFQQLLAAAYTLQEHKDDWPANRPRRDPAKVFSEIADARARILVDEHDFPSALSLIVNCLRSLTGADGASICLVNDGYLSCVACSGTAAKVPGGAVASNSLVATERLRNGRAFQSANARSDIRLEPSLCLELQIGSLLAVPIERNNQVAGLVELRWNDADAFDELDERTCELAIGLIGELLDREFGPVSATAPSIDEARVGKPSQNPHPVSPQNGETRMGHPILKPVMPKFDGLLEELRHEGSSSSLPTSSPAASSHLPVALSEGSPGAAVNNCRVCGHALNEKDDSCGNCGMPAHSTDDGMQSKWASMWFMQQATKAVKKENEQDRSERMWPLEEIKADSGGEPGSLQAGYSNANDENQNAENQNADTDADQSDEALAGAKRGPRSVLSVLKLHFKGRGIARKLSALVFMALLKKFS
jgi:ribosomal protein L37E